MSFFDSMKKAFDNETNRINESRERSSYKSVKVQKQEYYDSLNSQSDGALLNKLRSLLTSDDDKKIITSILEGRGYRRNKQGQFNRF